MIEMIKGDIFEHLGKDNKLTYLVHVVNNAGKWGAGFTSGIDRHFGDRPRYSYHNFINSYDSPQDALGCWYQTMNLMHNVTLIHLCAMNGVYNKYVNPKPLVYSALSDALENFYDFAEDKDCVVYMPKIGAGLARGMWVTIYGLIHKHHTVPTRIFEL